MKGSEKKHWFKKRWPSNKGSSRPSKPDCNRETPHSVTDPGQRTINFRSDKRCQEEDQVQNVYDYVDCKVSDESSEYSQLDSVETGEELRKAKVTHGTSSHVNQANELVNKGLVPFMTLAMANTELLLADNQTSEDFFRLTVLQVFHLLRHCSLSKIAEICIQQKLDGRFFKSYDLDEMQDEPFKASRFQIMKMKQIIYAGWRPKL